AHVLETHTHADHVSGRGRLLEVTGASTTDDDVVSLGDVTIRRLPTPGHRPEHVAYTVSDTTRADEPWLVLTGDSLFVGDVARPDAGAVLVDGRESREFDAVHVPGSLSVTLKTTAVGTRAAWVLDPECDVIVLAAGDAEARRLARLLDAVAFRRIRGFVAGGI